MAALVIALLVVGQAAAVKVSESPKLNPPLKDVKSDKKFFGPPFPADYPEDGRPVISKSIWDKVMRPGMPYPALQGAKDFDSDYVKDENSDKGMWQAQFEYDTLRKKLAQEEADAKRAEDRANREGADADGAQNEDDEAGKNVNDAQKDVDEAIYDEKNAKKAEDFGGPPTEEKLKEIKKAVAEAEAAYEKAQKGFEECKRQLEEAKKNFEDLTAEHKALEEKLAADTKLYVEQKTVKFNLKKAKNEQAKADFAKTKTEKVQVAQAKLAAAEKIKDALEKVLVKEKAENSKAQITLQKQQAEVEAAKKQIATASAKLQKLHGYKPAVPSPDAKSGVEMTSVSVFFSLVIAAQLF